MTAVALAAPITFSAYMSYTSSCNDTSAAVPQATLGTAPLRNMLAQIKRSLTIQNLEPKGMHMHVWDGEDEDGGVRHAWAWGKTPWAS